MFGHDDHDDENDKPAEDIVKPADADASDTPAPAGDDWKHPGPPPADDDDDDSSDDSDDSDDGGNGNSQPASFFVDKSSAPANDKNNGNGNDLIDLKQEALGKLTPLVSHLDQKPDEKFRTLMMMIQASDDQSLVREAYKTALNIDDEKERAQALLDIVNEINYFTQNPSDNSD